MQMINDQGGINGRKINLISADDGYLLWRTGDGDAQADRSQDQRRLYVRVAWNDHAATAVVKISERAKNPPSCFIERALTSWGNYKETPYTIGGVRAELSGWERVSTPGTY